MWQKKSGFTVRASVRVSVRAASARAASVRAAAQSTIAKVTMTLMVTKQLWSWPRSLLCLQLASWPSHVQGMATDECSRDGVGTHLQAWCIGRRS